MTSAAVCAFLQYTEPRFKLKNRPPAPKPYPPDRTAVREPRTAVLRCSRAPQDPEKSVRAPACRALVPAS